MAEAKVKAEELVAAPDTMIVHVPRERNDKEDKVVWVNAQRYVIQKGVDVEVPRAVAMVLINEKKLLDKQYAFQEQISN